ncbi:Hypothetical predicted protein [Octopus vulgaris]|uniref:Uncharacterized protein n=1 Tax=Octopus vulgaris TaxID=6645 RepID=A0AA36AI93_OCTVU|nr:Hypothetical predicted protein [Octopus vulgaris]
MNGTTLLQAFLSRTKETDMRRCLTGQRIKRSYFKDQMWLQLEYLWSGLDLEYPGEKEQHGRHHHCR